MRVLEQMRFILSPPHIYLKLNIIINSRKNEKDGNTLFTYQYVHIHLLEYLTLGVNAFQKFKFIIQTAITYHWFTCYDTINDTQIINLTINPIILFIIILPNVLSTFLDFLLEHVLRCMTRTTNEHFALFRG